jgi:DNA-directed RNA polymerase beta subunit
MLTQELSNRLIAAYFLHPDGSLFHHQIDTYDEFISVGIQGIVHQKKLIRLEAEEQNGAKRAVEVEFGRVTVFPPCTREPDGETRALTPIEARMRKMTYQLGVGVDVTQRDFVADANGEIVVHERVFREVPIIKIPCMVNSRYCVGSTKYDRDTIGGYFIINGHEKTCQSQIKLRVNCPFVHKGTTGYYSEVRSCNEMSWRSTVSLRVLAKRNSKHGLTCTVPGLQEEVPLLVVLGILAPPFMEMEELVNVVLAHVLYWTAQSDDDIARNKIDANVVEQAVFFGVEIPSTGDTQSDCTALAAQEYTKERTPERRMAAALRTFNVDMLPHLGVDRAEETLARKFTYVCMMAAQSLSALHSDRPDSSDNRDHWRHKRIDACGPLIAMLFRQLWRNFSRSFEMQLRKSFEANGSVQLLHLMSSRKMETGMKYHFSTGVWSVMKGVDPSANSGVCQAMSRMSRMAAISSLRRINCPVNRQGKTSMPRMLHISDYGHVCTTETPEGSGCGLILNLPLICHVRSGGVHVNTVINVLTVLLGEPQKPGTSPPDAGDKNCSCILIGGFIWGCVQQSPQDVLNVLREARHAFVLPRDATICVSRSCVFLNCDSGAVVRPIIRLDRVHLLAHADSDTWDSYFATGAIEYVDQEEIDEHCCVAATPSEVLWESPHR